MAAEHRWPLLPRAPRPLRGGEIQTMLPVVPSGSNRSSADRRSNACCLAWTCSGSRRCRCRRARLDREFQLVTQLPGFQGAAGRPVAPRGAAPPRPALPRCRRAVLVMGRDPQTTGPADRGCGSALRVIATQTTAISRNRLEVGFPEPACAIGQNRCFRSLDRGELPVLRIVSVRPVHEFR